MEIVSKGDLLNLHFLVRCLGNSQEEKGRSADGHGHSESMTWTCFSEVPEATTHADFASSGFWGRE